MAPSSAHRVPLDPLLAQLVLPYAHSARSGPRPQLKDQLLVHPVVAACMVLPLAWLYAHHAKQVSRFCCLRTVFTVCFVQGLSHRVTLQRAQFARLVIFPPLDHRFARLARWELLRL